MKVVELKEALKELKRQRGNDSKLIMQLSKKLETLLMENEDLRDNNDRLNQRLVQVECRKMNIVAQANGGN
jgi:regulator of replication initiation timing